MLASLPLIGIGLFSPTSGKSVLQEEPLTNLRGRVISLQLTLNNVVSLCRRSWRAGVDAFGPTAVSSATVVFAALTVLAGVPVRS